jgi:rod shape-determining protein MreC
MIARSTRRGAERHGTSGKVQRNGLLLAVLLGLQLLVVSASTRGDRAPAALESWTMRLSSPGVRLARVVRGTYESVTGPVRELWTVRRRNEVLEQEVRRLTEDLARSREAEPENRRLRRLLDVREALAPRSIEASVVTSYLDDRTGMVVLDRGTEDGVRADMAVVAWGGVVGRVMQAGATRSKVRLLIDSNSGVSGVVQRSRAEGIAVGASHDRLDLEYVPGHEDVALGDRVVSSGLDGIFPRGFGIGRVTAVTADPDGSRTYHLKPELDFGGLEEVLVLLDSAGAVPESAVLH